jgi:hypothetical protein
MLMSFEKIVAEIQKNAWDFFPQTDYEVEHYVGDDLAKFVYHELQDALKDEVPDSEEAYEAAMKAIDFAITDLENVKDAIRTVFRRPL